jgi:hypothetical protein
MLQGVTLEILYAWENWIGWFYELQMISSQCVLFVYEITIIKEPPLWISPTQSTSLYDGDLC